MIKICLIEDDPGDQKLIRIAINEAVPGVVIIPFTVGDDAITFLQELLTSEKGNMLPEVIFLDLNLPKISGISLLKELKQHKLLCTIPVVIFTTSNAEPDINSAYLNYASGYFRKPSDIKSLKEIVKIILDYWSKAEHPKY